MAEVLEAILQLDINSFTAGLQQAAQQVTAFAQAIQGSMQAAGQSFQQQVQQINRMTEAIRVNTTTRTQAARQNSEEMEEFRQELRLQLEEFRTINRQELAEVTSRNRLILEDTKRTAGANIATYREEMVALQQMSAAQRRAMIDAAAAFAESPDLNPAERLEAIKQTNRLILADEKQTHDLRLKELQSHHALTLQSYRDNANGVATIWGDALARISTSLRTLGGYLAASFILSLPFQLLAAGKAAVQTAMEVQALHAAFAAITGSTAKANQELAFLRQTATRVGADFLETAKQFRNLEAAARGTSLEGERVRAIFEAVATTSRVMGLSSDQTSRALLALEQMISKGTISAEELRKQLSQAIPGSVNIMARALGVGTDELQKMMKAGELMSVEVLPKFAAQLQEEFGPGLEKAATTARASFARLGNEVRDISAAMGQDILKVLQPVTDLITRLLEKSREAAERAKKTLGQRAAELMAGKPIAVYQGTEMSLPAGYTEKEADQAQALVEKIVKIEAMLARPVWQRYGITESGQKELAMLKEEFDAIVKTIEAREELRKQREIDDVGGQTNAGRASVGKSIVDAQEQYNKRVEEVLELHKNIPTEMQKAITLAKAFPDVYEEAEEKLKAIKKSLTDYQDMLKKDPDLRLDPRIIDAEKKTSVLAKTAQDEIDRIKAKAKAEKEYQTESQRLARETVENFRKEELKKAEFEQKIREEEARAEEGSAGQKLEALRAELDEMRKVRVAETEITQYESNKRVRIYHEEFLKISKEMAAQLPDVKRIAQERIATEDMITKYANKATKTRLDDFDSALQKEVDLMHERINQGKATEDDLTALRQAGAEARSRLAREESAKLAKEAARPWTELGNTISGILNSAFRNILSGSKSIFDSIRDAFLNLLAKLAADAVAHQVIIPIIMQVSGSAGGGGIMGGLGTIALGAAGGSASGGQGGGLVNQAVTLVSGANSISGALGGPSATSLMAGTGAQGLLDMPLLSGTMLAGEGISISSVAAPIGLGIAVGQILSMLNHMMGFRGGWSDAAAGAGGGAAAGALAGTTIFPGIGTAIGALGGALLGAFTAGISSMSSTQREKLVDVTRGFRTLGFNELLGRGSTGGRILEGIVTAGTGTMFSEIFGPKKEPGFQIRDLRPGQVKYDDVLGLTVEQDFKVLQDFHEKLGIKYETFIGTVNDSINVLFKEVVRGFSSATPQVQKAIVEPLNDMFRRIADQIEQYRKVGGDDMKEEMETMLATDFPIIFADASDDLVNKFMEAVAKIDPVIQAFNKIIDTLQRDIQELQRQQLALDNALQRSIEGLEESTASPAELLQRRRKEYEILKGKFEAGDEASKIELAPKLAELAAQIMELTKAVMTASYGDLTRIQATMKQIQEAKLTPEELLTTRKADMAAIMEEFRAASDTKKSELTPQILQLATEIMGLSVSIDDLAEQVEEQRKALVKAFPDQMRGLTNALFSPAQSFLAGQQQLRELVQEFYAADAEEQLTLEPQIAALAQQILGLAANVEVLGQDPTLLRRTQQDLIAVVQGVQNAIVAQQQTEATGEAALLETLRSTQHQVMAVLHEVEYATGMSIANAGAETIRALWGITGAITNTTIMMSNGIITAQYTTGAGVVTAQYDAMGRIMNTEHYVGGVLVGSISNTTTTVGSWSSAIYEAQQRLVNEMKDVREKAHDAYDRLQAALEAEIALAERQIELLVDSLYHLETVDAVVAAALGVLGEMNWRLGNPLGIRMEENVMTQLQRESLWVAQQSLNIQGRSQQALIAIATKSAYGLNWEEGLSFARGITGRFLQHGGIIPFNMNAFLHRGERVVPEWETRHSSGRNIMITVYGGNRDPGQIADLVIQRIEQKSGRLQSTTIQTSRR